MDCKVLIADSAIADLKEIVEFVAKDNPEAAIRLNDPLAKAFGVQRFLARHSLSTRRSFTRGWLATAARGENLSFDSRVIARLLTSH
jgi:plasmid stabilization system protein ParE